MPNQIMILSIRFSNKCQIDARVSGIKYQLCKEKRNIYHEINECYSIPACKLGSFPSFNFEDSYTV